MNKKAGHGPNRIFCSSAVWDQRQKIPAFKSRKMSDILSDFSA
jgi:hypothetical protein